MTTFQIAVISVSIAVLLSGIVISEVGAAIIQRRAERNRRQLSELNAHYHAAVKHKRKRSHIHKAMVRLRTKELRDA